MKIIIDTSEKTITPTDVKVNVSEFLDILANVIKNPEEYDLVFEKQEMWIHPPLPFPPFGHLSESSG